MQLCQKQKLSDHDIATRAFFELDMVRLLRDKLKEIGQ